MSEKRKVIYPKRGEVVGAGFPRPYNVVNSIENCCNFPRRLMEEHVKGASIVGYERLIDDLVLPDPNDRHVQAAAIHDRVKVLSVIGGANGTRRLQVLLNGRLRVFHLLFNHPCFPLFHLFIGRGSQPRAHQATVDPLSVSTRPSVGAKRSPVAAVVCLGHIVLPEHTM